MPVTLFTWVEAWDSKDWRTDPRNSTPIMTKPLWKNSQIVVCSVVVKLQRSRIL
jgi:hypothetical protein